MKVALRAALFVLSFIFISAVAALTARPASASTYANLSFDYANNGNGSGTCSGSGFQWYVTNKFGTTIKSGCDSFSGGSHMNNNNQSFNDLADNSPYVLHWDPVTNYALPAPGDEDCRDPKTDFYPAGISTGDGFGNTIVVYVVTGSFTCNIPSEPVAPAVSPINQQLCLGGSTGGVQFQWTRQLSGFNYNLSWNGQPEFNVGDTSSYDQYGFAPPGSTVNWQVRSSASGYQNGPYSYGNFVVPSSCGGGGSPPTVDLKANSSDGPISVSSGSSVSVTWSTTNSPSSCSGSGGASGWPGAKALPSGGQSVTVNSSVTFTITCSKSGFSDVSDSVTVNVSGGAPSCSASPSTVNINTNTTVTGSGGGSYIWSAPGGSPSSGSGNSFVVQYGTTGTKTVTVTSGGLTGSCSISVTQSGSGPTVTLSASPSSLGSGGGSSTLTWTPGNSPTSCTASGAWSGSKTATNGPHIQSVSVTTTSTYWITCSKAGYSDAQASATVTVAAGGGAKSCTFSKNPVNVNESFTVISNNVPVGVNRIGQSNAGNADSSSGPPTNFSTYYAAGSAGSTETMTIFYSDSTQASCTVTVNPLPSVPGNLDVDNGCLVVNQPSVTFDWTAPSSGDPATSYTLEVKAASFTTDNTPNSSSGVVTVNGGATTQFTWDNAHPMASGALTVPASNTNYWWRVRSNSSGGSSLFNYYDGTSGYNPRSSQQDFRTSNCVAPTNLTATPRACPNNTTVDLAWTGSATNWTIDVDDDGNFGNGWMASKSIASGTSTTAPNGFNNGLAFTPGQTYYWRIFYNVPSTWAVGPSFTIPVCAPTGLTVSGPGGVGSAMPACSTAAGYGVTLSWASSGPGWFVDLSADPTFSSFSNKDVSLTLTPAPAGFNPALTLLPDITYYWRIYYGVPGAHVYPPSSSVGPGTGFSVPGCIDLKARFVQPFGAQAFSPGDPVSLTVRVRNIGTGGSAATTVGLWLGQPGETNSPVMTETACTPGVLPAPQSQNVGALPPGAQQQVTFNFNAPGTTGTYVANAYVIPNCDQADIYWRNNNTSGEDQVGVSEEPNAPVGGFSYTVTVNAWFEAKDGDVGAAGGGVTMAQVPPSGSNAVSAAGSGKPLLVTVGTATAGGTSQQLSNYVDGITITGYSSALMSAGTYNYLADRYRQKAIDAAGPQCSLESLPAGLAYCPNGLTLMSGAAPAVNTAWFIDGDLVINGNITVPGALAFIVNGNITVNSAVSNIQGLYIASGTFTDVDASTGAGPQLVVNGAVYAGSISLPRELGGACGAICNNVLYPAASFVFDPKYLVNLNTLIGTPAVNWQEVAP